VVHLRNNGFTVNVTDVDDIAAVKAARGVPKDVQSCHTAVVDGYVLEGHVPAEDVKRLLKERPPGVAGIAVPGMPIGSPGMEVPGQAPHKYNVMAFGKDGKSTVFASH
jgi:hypothetical protein